MHSGRSVLVVDDEPDVRAMIAGALMAAGYAPLEASSGAAAIRILDKVPADLAIIDMFMPDKDGVETIIEVKKLWPAMKVIAMSGGGVVCLDDILRVASILGADATLRKPLDIEDMVAKVTGLLTVESAPA